MGSAFGDGRSNLAPPWRLAFLHATWGIVHAKMLHRHSGASIRLVLGVKYVTPLPIDHVATEFAQASGKDFSIFLPPALAVSCTVGGAI